LNGKTLDRNSNYFSRYCFEHGIELKRVEVIADDEAQIMEASRRMVHNYDFVITSGGIGPTHDDITYASLARAFTGGKLSHHKETLRRMAEMSKHRTWAKEQTKEQKEQREARERMALFPACQSGGGDNAIGEEHGGLVEVLFVKEDIWVPVVRLQRKLCVFPGIPVLFQKMLDSLTPYLSLPPKEERPLRLQVFTTMPESSIAPYLTALQKRVQPEGIRIGSYPVLQKGVYVSLIGSDKARVKQLGEEVEKETQGREVSEEEALEKRRMQSGSFGG